MIQSTRLAKCVYWLASKAAKIKTYQQTYRWVNSDVFMTSMAGQSLPEIESEKAGRVWLPWNFSLRLLLFSETLDVEHWDHWAFLHPNCGGEPCPKKACGGTVDDPYHWDDE